MFLKATYKSLYALLLGGFLPHYSESAGVVTLPLVRMNDDTEVFGQR